VAGYLIVMATRGFCRCQDMYFIDVGLGVFFYWHASCGLPSLWRVFIDVWPGILWIWQHEVAVVMAMYY